MYGYGYGLTKQRKIGIPTLFHYAAGDPLADVGGTFSRTSEAVYSDDAQTLQTAASGVLRDSHYAYNPASALYERSTLLEKQETNNLLQSEDFTAVDWDSSLLNGVTADADTAPDGSITADQIDFAADAYVRQSIAIGTAPASTVTTDNAVTVGTSWDRYIVTHQDNAGTYWTFSCYLKAASNQSLTLRLEELTDGTLWAYIIDAGSTAPSVVAWGAQLEGHRFPTSYVQTTTAAVTRAGDSLSADYQHKPQPMTAYIRLFEGQDSQESARPIQIGGSPYNKYSLAFYDTRRGRLNNDDGAHTVNTTTSFSKGDLVEYRLWVDSSNIGLEEVVNEGASATSTSAHTGLPPSWSSNEVILGKNFNYTHVHIRKGVNDLQTMREEAGVI